MALKPVLNYQPKEQQKPLLQNIEKKKWRFSFRFWRQIEYFGLDRCSPSWFVSFLERLQDLSNQEIKSFISDGTTKEAYRYHTIDWNQKNIPIQRKDLVWIDEDYRENEMEFPLLQFQISKSLGRIVGFWDEFNVFNIVLLDPLHNIQPAKSHHYKVNDCSPLSCDYSSLLYDIEKIKNQSHCTNPNCAYAQRLNNLPSKINYINVLMHYIDDIDLKAANQLIKQKKANSLTEIFQYGIAYLEDNENSNNTS